MANIKARQPRAPMAAENERETVSSEDEYVIAEVLL